MQVFARSTALAGHCPNCHTKSYSLHGWHQRAPQDLPCIGNRVRLALFVRRFRCVNAACLQRTFVERFPEWLPSYARRTMRLTKVMQQIGYQLGGESGSRILKYLQIAVSGDTVLRVIRQLATLSLPDRNIRHIGIDDWAVKKGRNYGTIIVDLERHVVIDLLPDRAADTVAGWLKDHPSIEVIARDRSPDYINGIQAGAPQALQVADRWHLLLNLTQMVERFLGTMYAKLRKLPMAEPYKQALQAQGTTFQRTKSEQQLSALSRNRRVERYEQVQLWRREGYNITQIALMLNCSWETARDYFYPTEFPERKQHGKKPNIIIPYIPYLEKRLMEGCENASQLWREVQTLGYHGSIKLVASWMRQHRTRPAPSNRWHNSDIAQTTVKFSAPRLPSARHLAWVMVKDIHLLTDTERLSLTHIQQESTVVKVYDLAQRFITMSKQGQVEQLDLWLTACATTGIRQVQSFAQGIRQDYSAVQAALVTSWSNGQTEGQVNRLKFVKRQMYGRAHFDLLRLRVLHPP